MLAAAVVLSSVLIGGSQAWDPITDPTAIPRVLLIVVVCQLCLHYVDLYDLRTIHNRKELASRLMRAIGMSSASAAICASTVSTPCPTDDEPT